MKMQLLLATMLIFLVADDVNAMSCALEHPQTAFCRSNFVIKAEVSKIGKSTDSGLGYPSIDMQMKIIRIYKGAANLKANNGDTIQIHTLLDKDALQKDIAYLVSGLIYVEEKRNTFMVNQCNWVQPWSKVTLVQRLGLQRHYQRNCRCTVRLCSAYYRCSAGQDACQWNLQDDDYSVAAYKYDCTSQNSLCFYSDDRGCNWYKPQYLKCRGESVRDPVS